LKHCRSVVETFLVGTATSAAGMRSRWYAAQFEANTRLMERFGAPGTPALVWKDKAGSVRVKIGMPRLSQLSAITGLPQKIDDPELAESR